MPVNLRLDCEGLPHIPARIDAMNGSVWKNQIVKVMSTRLPLLLALADSR